MLERGYIEFNPNPIYINDVFEEVAKEILGDMLPENHETTHFILSPLDGLSYSFYFVKELPDLPNIVVAVYKNGKGFYKINYDLEGEIKYFRDNTTGEEFEILLFD
jgi:hypothetical protein